MKQRLQDMLRILLMTVLILVLAHIPTGAAEKKPKERLAVLDLEVKHGVDKSLAEALSVIVRDKLHSFGDYQVMSKNDLQVVASREQLKQALGCDDDSGGQCLIDFGRAIGTRFMVAGDISKIGSTFTVSLRMLDTKSESAGVTNRVSEACKCDHDALIGTVQDVAAKLVGKPIAAVAKKIEEEKKLNEEKKIKEEAEQKRIAEEIKKSHELILKAEAEATRRLAEEMKREEKAEQQKIIAVEMKTAETEKVRQKIVDEEQRKAELEEQRLISENEKLKKEAVKVESEAELNPSDKWNKTLILSKDEKFDEALQILNELLDTTYKDKAKLKIDEISLEAAKALRKKAAVKFTLFTKTADVEGRKRLLVEAWKLLTDILVKYPNTGIAPKAMDNRERVEQEMMSLDPKLLASIKTSLVANSSELPNNSMPVANSNELPYNSMVTHNKTKPGCFIATAAFGSPQEEHVVTLREFRDRYLTTHHIGKIFIEFYYKHSPPIAELISNNSVLKTITRLVLIPVAIFVSVILTYHHGLIAIWLFFFAMILVFISKHLFSHITFFNTKS